MTLQTTPVTYDDYRTLPDDGQRYEIIGGELLMSPGATFYHQIIVGNLFRELDNYVHKRKLGNIVLAPFDVVLSMTDVVQPDILYIAKDRSHIISQGKNIIAAPDLVVEVLSESTKTVDRTRKKSLYEKHGVLEYWIVDPSEESVSQLVLDGESFRPADIMGKSQTLISSVIEGLSIPIEKVFLKQ
jgi:Uma2 family endonuclease